jgi:hypothetical protein
MSDKIQQLLQSAEQQKTSASVEQSSVANAERTFTNSVEAENAFNDLKEKLFQISYWNKVSGVTSYAIFDENGNDLGDKEMSLNDFLRISLPGSGKYDWVKIIDVHRAENEIVLTVQPTFNPTADAPDKDVTSHFFTDRATNNFCLERKLETVKFHVIGLNEISNTQETGGVVETIRNFAAANVGSFTGFQIAEWKTFCERFLQPDK